MLLHCPRNPFLEKTAFASPMEVVVFFCYFPYNLISDKTSKGYRWVYPLFGDVCTQHILLCGGGWGNTRKNTTVRDRYSIVRHWTRSYLEPGFVKFNGSPMNRTQNNGPAYYIILNVKRRFRIVRENNALATNRRGFRVDDKTIVTMLQQKNNNNPKTLTKKCWNLLLRLESVWN